MRHTPIPNTLTMDDSLHLNTLCIYLCPIEMQRWRSPETQSIIQRHLLSYTNHDGAKPFSTNFTVTSHKKLLCNKLVLHFQLMLNLMANWLTFHNPLLWVRRQHLARAGSLLLTGVHDTSIRTCQPISLSLLCPARSAEWIGQSLVLDMRPTRHGCNHEPFHVGNESIL